MNNPYEQAKLHEVDEDDPYSRMQPEVNPYNQQVEGNYNPYVPPVGGPDAQAAYQGDANAFASDVNRLHSKDSSCHCQAFIATLFLVGGLAAGLILFINDTIPNWAMFCIIGGGYLFYLIIGCCCNKLGSYLSNLDKGENF